MMLEMLKIKIRGGGSKYLLPGQFIVDRNTPVGEPADYYEVLRGDGRRIIDSDKVLAVIHFEDPTYKPDL